MNIIKCIVWSVTIPLMWLVDITTESFHYNELTHAFHQHRPQSHQQLKIIKKKRKQREINLMLVVIFCY